MRLDLTAMDPRLQQIFLQQQLSRFSGLAGSEFGGTFRISDQLINQVIAASLPEGSAVRSLLVHSRAGNWFNVKVALKKPAFMPPLTVELAIDRQPELPHDPVLALRLTGGAGAVMKLASSVLSNAVNLPRGIRLEGERVLVDIRALLQDRGQGPLLDYVQQLCVATEESGVALIVLGKIS